jgi:Tol biopolymer transport system component
MNKPLINAIPGRSGRENRPADRLRATLFVCLAIASAAGLARGDDPPKAKAKAGPGRLLVRAQDPSREVPNGLRFEGFLSVNPETGDWKPIGDRDLEVASLSPDGRFLAGAVSSREDAAKEGVWVYDLTREIPRRRVFDRLGVPSWSNDGSQLVIGSNIARGRYETYRVKADGSGLTKLPIPEGEFVINCSPDGSWLASHNPVRKTLETHILLTHPDGTGSHEVVNAVNLSGAAQISPNGREVVYAIYGSDRQQKTESSVWIVGIDGGNRRRVPVKLEGNSFIRPCWSPDGSRLAINVIVNGQPRPRVDEIVVIDLDGKNSNTLPLPPWRLSLHDWK